MEKPTIIMEPVDHVSNVVQSTQQHLAMQLQQMQAMIQATQMQYYVAPQHAHQYYEVRGCHGGHTNYRSRV